MPLSSFPHKIHPTSGPPTQGPNSHIQKRRPQGWIPIRYRVLARASPDSHGTSLASPPPPFPAPRDLNITVLLPWPHRQNRRDPAILLPNPSVPRVFRVTALRGKRQIEVCFRVSGVFLWIWGSNPCCTSDHLVNDREVCAIALSVATCACFETVSSGVGLFGLLGVFLQCFPLIKHPSKTSIAGSCCPLQPPITLGTLRHSPPSPTRR